MSTTTATRPVAATISEHSVRATLLEAVDNLEGPFRDLVKMVCRVSLDAPKRAQRLNRPRYGLRLLIVAAVLGVSGAIAWVLRFVSFSLEGLSPHDLLGVVANTCDCLVLIPVLLSVLLLEVRLKRWKVLQDLKDLEALNDKTYELQFNENAHSAERVEDLIQILDVCCGLLFLVRKAAGAYSVSSDPVVLERIGVIRRGCNDNHRNILMKIAMAMSKSSSQGDSLLSAA